MNFTHETPDIYLCSLVLNVQCFYNHLNGSSRSWLHSLALQLKEFLWYWRKIFFFFYLNLLVLSYSHIDVIDQLLSSSCYRVPLRFAFLLPKILNCFLRLSWLQVFISALLQASLPAHNFFGDWCPEQPFEKLQLSHCQCWDEKKIASPVLQKIMLFCFLIWHLLILQLCEKKLLSIGFMVLRPPAKITSVFFASFKLPSHFKEKHLAKFWMSKQLLDIIKIQVNASSSSVYLSFLS